MKRGGVRPRPVRIRGIAAAVVGGFAILAVGLWLARAAIAAWLIAQAAERIGLGPSEVEIIALGPSHASLRLHRSAVGTLERLDLDYRLDRGLSGALDRIRIAGARIHLEWKDGRLHPALAADGGPLALPAARIEIVDSSLTLNTATTTIVADISGTIARGARGDLFAAKFAFAQIGIGANRLGPGELTVALRQPQVLMVSLQSVPLRLALRADGSHPANGVPFTADGAASAGFVGGLTGAFAAKTGDISISASGTTPPISSSRGATSLPLEQWMRMGTVDGALRSAVTALDIPGIATVKNALAELRFQLAEGVLRLTTSEGLSVSGVAVAAPNEAPAGALSRISRLSIAPARRAPLLTITRNGGDHRIEVAGTVALDAPRLALHGPFTGSATFDTSQWAAAAAQGAATGQFGLQGNMALALSPTRSSPAVKLVLDGSYMLDPATFELTADHGGLTLSDTRWGDTLSLPGAVRAELRAGAKVSRDRHTREIRVSASLQPIRWNAVMSRPDAQPLQLTLSADHLAFTQDRSGRNIALKQGAIELPASHFAAREITGNVTAGATTSIRLNVANLRSTADPALFTPLLAALEARIADGHATFTGALRDSAQRIRVGLKGTHRLDTGRGSATFTLAPVELSGTGTVAALSPAVGAHIESAAGTIAGQGAFHWGERALPGALSLVLKDVALGSADFKASGLNGALQLDGLAPLRSPGGQKIAGVFQFPAVKQVPFTITFRLAPGKLLLEHGTAEIFGGMFETADAEIDVATGAGRADVTIRDLDLEAAFTVLNLEQLQGSGRLSGVLPLRMMRGAIALDNGHLEAAGPGVVRIGVQALADQLKSYGENVDLAFRALTDFHYARLTIDADKPLLGTGRAMFRLEGNNPAVLEGQPFIFNISLETDFDRLANVLRELSAAAQQVLSWSAQEGFGQ